MLIPIGKSRRGSKRSSRRPIAKKQRSRSASVLKNSIRAFYKSWAQPLGTTIFPVRFVAEDPHCVMEFEASTKHDPDRTNSLSMEIFTVNDSGKILRMAIYRRPREAAEQTP